MFKSGLSAIIVAVIFQTGAMAQVYVKNTGNVGIGVTEPSAKLELPNNGNASLRVGVSSNMANCHTQLINSLAVLGDDPSSIASIGAVAHNFYNNGNNPSWAGTMLFHYGTGFGQNAIYPNIPLAKGNLGVLQFQNTSSGLITGSGNIYVAPQYNLCATFMDNGNVGIGVSSPTHKLHVLGTVRAVNFLSNTTTYADYVFDSTYQLPNLQQVETYINQNHHLPEVPTEAEVKKNGLDIGQHQVILLKKVEELTLYAIQQDKKQLELDEKIKALEQKTEALIQANNKLTEELRSVKTKKKRK